jgi:hypothetical protein
MAQQDKQRDRKNRGEKWGRGSLLPPAPSPSSISIVKAKCERDSEQPAPHSHSQIMSFASSFTPEKSMELASLRLFLPSRAIRAADVSRFVTIYAPRSPPAALEDRFSTLRPRPRYRSKPQEVRSFSTLAPFEILPNTPRPVPDAYRKGRAAQHCNGVAVASRLPHSASRKRSDLAPFFRLLFQGGGDQTLLISFFLSHNF